MKITITCGAGFIGVQYAKMPREKRDTYSKIARDFLESQRGY